MSKATNQSMVLLVIAYGSVKSICENFTFAPKFNDTILAASNALTVAVMKWPATGKDKSARKWVADKVATWDFLMSSIPPQWSMTVRGYLAQHILTALLGKVKDPVKVDLLNRALIPVEEIITELDAQVQNMEALQYCEKVLEELYKLVEFEENIICRVPNK